MPHMPNLPFPDTPSASGHTPFPAPRANHKGTATFRSAYLVFELLFHPISFLTEEQGHVWNP